MKCYRVKVEDGILFIASDEIMTYEQAQAYAERMGHKPKNIEEYKHVVMHIPYQAKEGYGQLAFIERFTRDSFLYECKKGK